MVSNPDYSWKGFKEFAVTEKIDECPNIVSLCLKAKDGAKLVKHKAGQFLPIKIMTDDEKYAKVTRAYSLAMEPNDEYYKISIKKVENGIMSSYICDHIKVGDSVLSVMPKGNFVINDHENDTVFFSGGIGVTPLLSMLYEESAFRNNMHFVQAVQNSDIHPFRDEIEKIAKEKGIKNTIFYSSPLENDQQGVDYDYCGYINKEFIKQNINLNADFFICGPAAFMKAVENMLLELGADSKQINYESFM